MKNTSISLLFALLFATNAAHADLLGQGTCANADGTTSQFDLYSTINSNITLDQEKAAAKSLQDSNTKYYDETLISCNDPQITTDPATGTHNLYQDPVITPQGYKIYLCGDTVFVSNGSYWVNGNGEWGECSGNMLSPWVWVTSNCLPLN